jgi:hypothetical protein
MHGFMAWGPGTSCITVQARGSGLLPLPEQTLDQHGLSTTGNYSKENTTSSSWLAHGDFFDSLYMVL